MKVAGLFSALRTTLAGMSNQMKRMNVISENIANAERSPDEKGKVYQRKIVVPEKTGSKRSGFKLKSTLSLRRSSADQFTSQESRSKRLSDEVLPVKVVAQKGVQLVYNPSHPRADENGYVRMPNVNVAEEMVDLISATRTYEANVTVLNAAKQMAKKAMEI